MDQNNCSSAAGSICSWTARYVGPRTGATFQDLGPVSSTDTAPPGASSGQKALGVKVNVTKTPQTYLLGVMGQSTWTVNTTATSVTGQPTGAPAGQLLPIAMVAPTTMERGLDLRTDQRLERAGQLRLDLMGRQQLRRIAGDQPLHARQSAVRPAVRISGGSRQDQRQQRPGVPAAMGGQPADGADPDRRSHERRPRQRQSAATPAVTVTASPTASSRSPLSSSPGIPSRRSTRSTAGSSGPSRIPSTATRTCREA